MENIAITPQDIANLTARYASLVQEYKATYYYYRALNPEKSEDIITNLLQCSPVTHRLLDAERALLDAGIDTNAIRELLK